MADDTTQQPPKKVSVVPIYPESPLPAEGVSFARFTHFGSQVVMDLGIVDDQTLVRSFKEDEAVEARINGFVLHRFYLSVETLQYLHRTAGEILGKMRTSGLLQNEGVKTDSE